MQFRLPFGYRSCWEMNLPESQVTRLGPHHSMAPIRDPATAIRDALAAPIDYPSLASATVPGDRVVVTLPAGVPAVQSLAQGILRAMRDAGVEFANLIFLVPDPMTEMILQGKQDKSPNQPAWPEEVRIVRHDPRDSESCGLLGVSQAGNPIRINRLIGKADLILPIGVSRVDNTLNDPTVKSSNEGNPLITGLFPEFSDQETLNHFFAPSSQENPVHRLRRLEEIQEATKLLTSGVVVQVVPASEDQVAKIFAGQLASVGRAAKEASHQTWIPSVSERGDLVIGLLTGNTSSQTWPNIGRVLQLADNLRETDGALVICSDLQQEIGRSLGRLCQQDERIAYEQEIMRDREEESWTALQLSRCLQRGPIYMHSKLNHETVENLGIAPLTSADELVRLIQKHRHTLILDDAQWLAPQVAQ